MRIAIDASRACKNDKTGVESYSSALISTWIRQEIQDELILFAPQEIPKKFQPFPKNWKWIKVEGEKLWSQYHLVKALRKVKHDILFVPSHIIPYLYKGLSVTTIHDVGYYEMPQLYEKKESFYQKWATQKSVAKANGIITPSNYSRKSLIKHFEVDPHIVKVIAHGFDNKLFYINSNGVLPEKLKKPYIYYVGRIEKKKNIIGALDAFRYLKNERNNDHQFVLAGKNGFGSEEIFEHLEKFPEEIKNQIHFLGYVDDSTNSVLMRNADIFFFPSWIEGFGFPILEAFASGVPVVCSNSTSLLEVAGNSAVLVDPDKPFSMAAALSKIINSNRLRELMIKTGVRKVGEFSWEKSASETLDYIRLIATRKN